MALVIAGNSLASYVNSQYNRVYRNLDSSVRRLASGLRINNAADDPADSAVLGIMRSDLAAYSQGMRNLNNALSLVQTASDALSVINEQLVKMKSLAEQSSTGTYTNEQRQIMQSEFESMGAEIDRISASTNFNGIKLLDGSLASTKNRKTSGGWTEADDGLLVHFGPNSSRSSDYYFISLPKSDSSVLFDGSLPSISTVENAQSALVKIESALVKSENLLSQAGIMQNRLQSTLDALTMQKANLEFSENRISSIDFAEEMVTYLSNLIQSQITVSMLSQANMLPQQALKLLDFK